MSKKVYTLISTLVDCAATAASAIVAYCQPENCAAIIAGIGIAAVAINDILIKFVK